MCLCRLVSWCVNAFYCTITLDVFVAKGEDKEHVCPSYTIVYSSLCTCTLYEVLPLWFLAQENFREWILRRKYASWRHACKVLREVSSRNPRDLCQRLVVTISKGSLRVPVAFPLLGFVVVTQSSLANIRHWWAARGVVIQEGGGKRKQLFRCELSCVFRCETLGELLSR